MSARDTGSRRFGALVAPAVVATLSLAAGWIVTDSLLLAASTPAQLDYIDGFMVDDAIRLARGGALYLDPTVPPYNVAVYTPGVSAVIAGLVAIGVDGFSAGRMISLLSMLSIVALIVASGVRRTGWVATLIGAAVLLHPLQWPWSLVIRPDLTAIALAIAAVLIALGPTRPRATCASALLCVAAILCKQTMVAAPAAILTSLLVRDRREAARFATLLVGTLAISVALLEWATHSRFLFSTVLANANPFSWERAIGMYRRFLTLDVLTAPLACFLFVRAVVRKQVTLVGGYAVIALLTALTAGKIGSSLNYFLEPLCAVSLWAAHELPVTWFELRHRGRIAIAALLLLVVVIASAASGLEQLTRHGVARAALPMHERLVGVVETVDGPVVSDNAAILVGAGKPVHYGPFIMAQLADAGRWDQTPFLEELRGKRIGMIIFQPAPQQLHHSRYTAEMRLEIERAYRVAFTYGLGAPFVVMVPRVDDPSRSVGPRPGIGLDTRDFESLANGG